MLCILYKSHVAQTDLKLVMKERINSGLLDFPSECQDHKQTPPRPHWCMSVAGLVFHIHLFTLRVLASTHARDHQSTTFGSLFCPSIMGGLGNPTQVVRHPVSTAIHFRHTIYQIGTEITTQVGAVAQLVESWVASSCLSLPSAGIIDGPHHTWPSLVSRL